ncbi:hypothetical protein QU814_01290 [Providencia rettgeri]|uniref:hypothetical protein n=1 Tax=Providencia rettgeri TaxID=587 RepID=UPI000D6FFF01|nr:hypothetical protein [Providencia rettgeri]MDM9281837.1 hypothetical protein [Providencia rettgeri]
MTAKTVEYLRSDDGVTLMMRGCHTVDQVINAAINQSEIDEDDRQRWENNDHFEVAYFKAVPRNGYGAYYYRSSESVRGAFIATVLMLL